MTDLVRPIGRALPLPATPVKTVRGAVLPAGKAEGPAELRALQSRRAEDGAVPIWGPSAAFLAQLLASRQPEAAGVDPGARYRDAERRLCAPLTRSWTA